MSLDFKGVSIIKKDVVPTAKEVVGPSEILKANESINSSTIKDQKANSIYEPKFKEAASQSINSLIPKGMSEVSYSEGGRSEPSRLPPVTGPVIYLAPIPAPPNGVPYGMSVNAQAAPVPAEACNVKGYVTDYPAKNQTSHKADSRCQNMFKAVSEIGENSRKIPFYFKDIQASKEQHKDMMTIFKKFAGLLGIVETNKSIDNSTQRSRKSIFGSLASQSVDSTIIKRLFGMARGYARNEGRDLVTSEHETYHK
eukprot:TRINITY_DN11708_c0_g1_i1.p1 TRINITY_DN11708_c0_g1~~TRINITY_DN11708_c0_g1_i1.p1  ORF type:complete len:254 (-),score=13.48 TRINITY_DN11708_c0_g1_i1:124-885(-)